MTKNLIFYWYIPSNCIMPDIYWLHIYNLKKYAKIFNNATFILSADNITDINKIEYNKNIINSIGFKCDIKFLLYKNDTNIRECTCFYNEIIQNLKNLEGITFFAHSKGITRNGDSGVPMWNTGLYYFNLNDIKSVENKLSKNDVFSYGSFKKHYNWIVEDNGKIYKQKHNWHYSGTFFWLDTQKIYKYIKSNNIEISSDLHRWYTEMWLGNIFDSNFAYTKYDIIGDENLYVDCKDILKNKMKVQEKEFNSFLKYYDNMVNKLSEEQHISLNVKEEKTKTLPISLTFKNPHQQEPSNNSGGLRKLIFK